MTPSKDAPQQTSEREELVKHAQSKTEAAEKKDKQPGAVPKQKGKKDKPKGKVHMLFCYIFVTTISSYVKIAVPIFIRHPSQVYSKTANVDIDICHAKNVEPIEPVCQFDTFVRRVRHFFSDRYDIFVRQFEIFAQQFLGV